MNNIAVFEGLAEPCVFDTAVRFGRDGHKVIAIVGENERDLAAKIRSEIENASVYRTDTSDATRIGEILKDVGEKCGRIDYLVTAASAHDDQVDVDGIPDDYNSILATIDRNVTPFRVLVEAAHDLMTESEIRRIAILSDKEASVRECLKTGDFGYQMSRASINMALKIFFNRYRPEGFTFRCFAAGAEGGLTPYNYIIRNLCFDPKEPYIHSDENRLCFRDGFYREYAW